MTQQMNEPRKLKIGITHGDINGIGYEVLLKAVEDVRIAELCTPIIYGSAKIASYYLKGAGQPPVPMTRIDSPENAREGKINIINVVGEDVKIEPGVLSKAAGEAAFAALERAVTDLRSGGIDAIVTAPINKDAIQSETFQFPGHTEYLEASLGDEDDKALMMLCAGKLRVALVTTHLPIAKVPGAITQEAIVGKLRILDRTLRSDFGCDRPRIAVLALNPHAGEGGLLGSEEGEVVAPAIAEATKAGILAFGPYAADGFFGTRGYEVFDAVLAMYHDQGLAPFKALAMDAGVNFTAGLPYVRTSPDHGTGFDIAGKWEASPESMRKAIYMAIDVVRSRARHARATANPLRKQYHDKGGKDRTVDLTKEDDTPLT